MIWLHLYSLLPAPVECIGITVIVNTSSWGAKTGVDCIIFYSNGWEDKYTYHLGNYKFHYYYHN